MSDGGSFAEVTGLPEWGELDRDYLSVALPVICVVRDAPKITLFFDGISRFGARFRVPSQTHAPKSPLESVKVVTLLVGGEPYVEVSVDSRRIFRNFYFFFSDLIIELDTKTDVVAALSASLLRWRALLQEATTLTVQRQAGLFGELWFLRHLVAQLGGSAVRSWTGPMSQAHDFRFGQKEFEVKATLGERRVHTISSLMQMVASPGCQLFLISILIQQGGIGGETVTDVVRAIRHNLEGSDLIAFELALGSVGYTEEDAERYVQSFRLSSPVVAIPGENAPRLSRQALQLLPNSLLTSRIVSASYEIDVTGLGFEESSPQFASIMPVNS